jgi:hypothetical protein
MYGNRFIALEGSQMPESMLLLLLVASRASPGAGNERGGRMEGRASELLDWRARHCCSKSVVSHDHFLYAVELPLTFPRGLSWTPAQNASVLRFVLSVSASVEIPSDDRVLKSSLAVRRTVALAQDLLRTGASRSVDVTTLSCRSTFKHRYVAPQGLRLPLQPARGSTVSNFCPDILRRCGAGPPHQTAS